MAYLEISNLTKGYPILDDQSNFKPVLEGINLAANEGDFVALFGPNGCGKTTLLHIIAGILDPDSGSVKIDGKHPRESKIGFVLQNFRDSLFPWLTGLNNISFPLALRGIPQKDRFKKVQSTLQQLSLDLPVHQYPYQMSGGQQQMVALTRALIDHPDVILMDEPFSALDYQTRLFMQMELQRIWMETKATVFFISHEIEEALLLADRLIILSQLPAKVLDVIEIQIPRPRSVEVVATEEFILLKKQALASFKEAIKK